MNKFLIMAAAFLMPILLVLDIAAQNGNASVAPKKLTAAEWQADVKFLAEEMPKRHRNLFHWLKREDFQRETAKLHDRIPSLTDDEIIVGLMQIMALAQDGHTALYPIEYFRSGIVPIRFYMFKDGLFVRKAAPEYAGIVGGKLVKIGSADAADALEAIKPLVFKDNEMAEKEIAPQFLSIPEILAGLKIIKDKQKIELTIEVGGKLQTIEVKPSATVGEFLNPPSNWIDAAGRENSAKALYLKDAGNFYWFEYLKDQKLVYVQQNAVQNKSDETLAAFYKRVFEFVAANPVEKFVLDLRHNNGGNNGLNRDVVVGLIKSKIDERGKLFVITGRRTFSAAQNLVSQIERYTNAVFVGEPTAGRPNHYGDARPLILPNSKLEAQVSSIWWQDVDARDVRRWTAPEIAAESSSEDYRINNDPALKAVFEYSPQPTFRQMVEAATTQADISDFSVKYQAYKNDSRHKYVETEGLMNRLGYFLMREKRTNDAVRIFELNAKSFPNSANAHDSLGEAYAAANDRKRAIESYEKALALNPNLGSAKQALQKLKGQ